MKIIVSIFESGAILIYLAELRPESFMIRKTEHLINQWLNSPSGMILVQCLVNTTNFIIIIQEKVNLVRNATLKLPEVFIPRFG